MIGGGQSFGVAIAYVTMLAVAVGVVCALAGCWGILSDRRKDPSIKLPSALYTVTLAAVIQLAYPLIMWTTSDEFAQRPILGTRMALFIWPLFSLPSIALYISSWWLARKDSHPASSFLRKSAIAVLAIWVLGFLSYIAAAD